MRRLACGDGEVVRTTGVFGTRRRGLRLRRRSAARVARRLRSRRRAQPCRRAVHAPRRLDGGAPSVGRSTTRAIRSRRCSKAPRATRRKRQAPPPQPSPAEPSRSGAGDELPCRREPGTTVAEVTGAEPDDPDATVAMPWMPEFDVSDDLGGLLAPTRRCSPAPSRARAAALTAPSMKTTITEPFPERAARRRCSHRSPRSTATRRGCASCTGSTPLAPDDGRPGVVGRAASTRRAVHPVEAAAHGAHRVRTTPDAGRASSASRPTTATTPSGSSTARCRRRPAGRVLTMHLEYTGELWSRACSAGSSTTRCGAARRRWRECSGRRSPRAEPAVAAALEAQRRGRSSRSGRAAVSTSSSAPAASTRPARMQQGVGQRSSARLRRGG